MNRSPAGLAPPGLARRASPRRGSRPTGPGGLSANDLVLGGLLALALLLGGGGSPAPLPELLLELAALAALVAVAWLGRADAGWPITAVLVSLALLALPAIQLAPLPPSLWRALPGREVEAAALALIEDGDRWMPWSLTPSRTLAALLALLPPLIVLVLAARASLRGRTAALVVIVALALLSALVGAGQLAGGDGSGLRFYGSAHAGFVTGFQANRNAAADVMLVGLVATAALIAAHRVIDGRTRTSSPVGLVAAIAVVLLVAATLLTGSRAGIALLLATLAGIAAWLARPLLASLTVRWLVALAAGGLAALGTIGWLLSAHPLAQRVLNRFAAGDEPRPELWTDTAYAIGQTWPVGGGLGSFVPLFVAAERLEVVDASHPNRAHNDFLELALEAGLPGLVLLAAVALALTWRLTRRLRADPPREERAQLVFAGATLALLAAHSIVDYPLRSMALATLAGFAAGVILGPVSPSGSRARVGSVETGTA